MLRVGYCVWFSRCGDGGGVLFVGGVGVDFGVRLGLVSVDIYKRVFGGEWGSELGRYLLYILDFS